MSYPYKINPKIMFFIFFLLLPWLLNQILQVLDSCYIYIIWISVVASCMRFQKFLRHKTETTLKGFWISHRQRFIHCRLSDVFDQWTCLSFFLCPSSIYGFWYYPFGTCIWTCKFEDCNEILKFQFTEKKSFQSML